MQETLDQFMTVLRFSHYYILHRLRQGRSQEEYQSLVKMIMTKHEEELKDEYEVLYKAVVRTEREYIVTYQTQTNIRTGTINLYSGNASVRTFPMRLADEVEAVALYHKAMPFEDIVTLAREKRSPTSKKFHHKLSDRVVETKNAETLTTPSPTSVSLSLFNTPIKRVGFGEGFPPIEVCVQPIQEAISRRLLLVSDSEEEGHVVKGEQGKRRGERDDEEDIVIVADGESKGEKQPQNQQPKQAMPIKKEKKSHQKNVFKGTHTSHRAQQVTQKKTAPQGPNPPITPSKKWQKNHQSSARQQRRRQQYQRLSKFMSGWTSKKQVDK